jgi:alpha-tubulin suppressor-like RCC1 family protein
MSVDNGDVYSWGRSAKGQLGHGRDVTLISPAAITALRHKSIVKICCGAEHSAALTKDGLLGNNEQGQCGNSDKTLLTPVLLSNSITASDVACGDSHTVFCTSE